MAANNRKFTQKKAQRRIGGVVTGPGGTEDILRSESLEVAGGCLRVNKKTVKK